MGLFPADEPGPFHNVSVRRLISKEKPLADKFRDLAREVDYDESKEAFSEAPGQEATAPPPLPPIDGQAEEEKGPAK